MHDVPLLTDTVVLFGTALVVAWLFRLAKAPSIIGFLVTGIVIGPSGLGFIRQEDVEPLAEIGLVLLLFTIGLELSAAPLIRMGRSLLQASLAQVGATFALAAAVLAVVLGLRPASALVLGVAVALSSTAIVLKQLSDRGATDTLAGRIVTGILLVQDVLVIVLMLFLPVLAPGEDGSWTTGALNFALGLAGMVAVLLIGRKVLPVFLDYVVRPGGREFATLFAVVMASGGAWLAGMIGWSMPLGACLAGLLLSEADERHQVVADILPFRDVFNALFFISLGMLVDVDVALVNAFGLSIAVCATIVAKIVITTAAVRLAGWPIRPALQVGLGLSTVSEFGYVLAREADAVGLFREGRLDALVVYTLGTMVLGSLLLPVADPLASFIAARVSRKHPLPDEGEEAAGGRQEHHVIVVGYGVNGQNVSRVLQSTRVPYVVVEMNAQWANEARKQGAPIILGDATRKFILDHAGLDTARILIVAINDPRATRQIVRRGRDARPDLYIIARTRFVADIEDLYEAGADLVIPEEFETSIEIAAHVLEHMDIPHNIVEGQLAAVRAGGYGLLRGRPTDHATAAELMKVFQLTTTRTHYVEDGSPADGKTVAELHLRAATGVTIIAVVRDGRPNTNPEPDFRLKGGDVLVLVGSHVQLEAARALLAGGSGEENS